MKTVGIICEYNPFHRGHLRQLEAIRREFGSQTRIVCAMSGNFVQRGAPAILDKSIRAEAAVRCGADLVLELPIPAVLSSAEGFAQAGVRVLAPLCDVLCFGTETAREDSLIRVAQTLCDPAFAPLLRRELDLGKSFPAARQAALEALGLSAPIHPNDLLGVEYCKAILCQGVPMVPFPIFRPGSYHCETPDRENPSAASVRRLMLSGQDWQPYVPEAAGSLFSQAPLHQLSAGERAILGTLRSMDDAGFEALPHGSEGLWRKFRDASRRESTLEEILTATKSKRYTRTRLDRMAMCAFLGITEELRTTPIPYTRVLAFNENGRSILNTAKKTNLYQNAGTPFDHPYWALEQRAGRLYGLFRLDCPGAPDSEARRRVRYIS